MIKTLVFVIANKSYNLVIIISKKILVIYLIHVPIKHEINEKEMF